MKAPSLFENIDHWFAIQREKARQNGYYYVEDLGHWSERDREIYLMYYPCDLGLYIGILLALLLTVNIGKAVSSLD